MYHFNLMPFILLRVRGASVACINKYDKGCIFLSNRVRRSSLISRALLIHDYYFFHPMLFSRALFFFQNYPSSRFNFPNHIVSVSGFYNPKISFCRIFFFRLSNSWNKREINIKNINKKNTKIEGSHFINIWIIITIMLKLFKLIT